MDPAGRALLPDTTDGHAALMLVYRTQRRALTVTARRMVGHEHVADELVNEVFCRLLERPPVADCLGAYVRCAVVNACRRHLRREAMERERVRRAHLVLADDVAEPEVLTDVLEALPRRYRAALHLRFHDDLSADEIAIRLGCEPATARSLVHRGLRMLRDQLATAV
jgi:RNA polymerase sigma factor (sigma-70 family)